MIGDKIKELRINNKMTQKELADKLYVTAQAVSRWENGEVEPSLSTLVEIAKIFNVSTDELLNISVQKEPEVKEVIVEKEIVYAEVPKQHLALCQTCNVPIYTQEDLIRIGDKLNSRILCKACYEKELAEEQQVKEKKEKSNRTSGLKRRIHSFVWGGLAAVLPLIATINSEGIENILVGVFLIYAVFTFVSTMILNNTFINDWFLSICSWSVISFPGVIWEFSFDGFLWLIGIKIIFWLIGLILGVIFCILAFIICSLLSIVVYPFALIKNIKNPTYFEV